MTSPTPTLRALVGGALTVPIQEIAPLYQAKTETRVEIFLGTTPMLVAEATSGRPFDLGVTPVDVMRAAEARVRFAPGPTMDVVRVGFGVAVRSGAPRPEIGTTEAFRAAMLAAQSISTIPESAGGTYILGVFDRLGIAEAVRPKLRAAPNPAAIPGAVANGEAELAIFLLNVLVMRGVDIVGPLPAELQRDLVFTGAVAATTPSAAAAQRFLDFLRGPEAAEVFRAKGLTPA